MRGDERVLHCFSEPNLDKVAIDSQLCRRQDGKGVVLKAGPAEDPSLQVRVPPYDVEGLSDERPDGTAAPVTVAEWCEQEIGEFPNNDHGPTTPPPHLGTIILQLATILARRQPLHPQDLDLTSFDAFPLPSPAITSSAQRQQSSEVFNSSRNHPFQEGLPCQLYSDASTQGIAGILKQVHPNNQIHPVQYYSRALRPHEQNYNISELECLAIIESVEKFRIYLTGTKFTIFSDHHALQWLKSIKNPTGRLLRWSLRLSAYDYEIRYIKGTQQYEADLLSRNPFCGILDADTTKIHQNNTPTHPHIIQDTNGLHTITRKGVTKILIPEKLRSTLLNKVHLEYNHPGISQMSRLISGQYNWSRMSRDIKNHVNSCTTCQLTKHPKGPTYGELGQIPPATKPFDLLSIDTLSGFAKYGNSKTHLHVIVDHMTRYAWTFPSKSTSTLTYIQAIKKVLVYGSPKRLLSDRAPSFT
ncbi:hypothetical protein LAZ67_1001894 [Cordylochernes scorpioides]|uniref:RNA-directed DNA polymerase n=1 Tax=Cordylochernes scorpioides TaxID=51811 RepID=A0ABY6JWV1_9ARAC|nr:hypothetical protein LAZ67_1001894 [Cordylochernes scorpioides]